MIIAVDFDGTLCMGTYPEIGSPKPYAVEVMNKLKADGHYLILWTCRRGERLEEAINWMLEQGIPFDRINAHEPANLAFYGDDARKVYAHCYIAFLLGRRYTTGSRNRNGNGRRRKKK